MCINKRLIINRKYTATTKNGGIIPPLNDIRQANVWIPCTQCYVCRRKKAREWRMRLTEDVKVNKNAKIVTLTFSTESLKELAKEGGILKGYELDNEICRIAVKRFRERWRKKYGRSIRHWLITELGHGTTEHVHMHGIVWEDERYQLEDNRTQKDINEGISKLIKEVQIIWKYGFVGVGKWDYKTGKYENYVNGRTANYFTKYVNKIDEEHKEYKQIILTSAGIGKDFLGTDRAKDNQYRGKDTQQAYNVENGGVLPMPDYFRRKMYTDEQREQLTSDMLDKESVYIEGREYKLSIGDDKINLMYKALQAKNARMGYGDGRKNYERKMNENAKRRAIHKKRGIN